MELARHPKMQSRLRAEIRETEAAIHARGDTQFTMADFDAMPYTTAVIKVRGVPLPVVRCFDSLCASLTRKDCGITQWFRTSTVWLREMTFFHFLDQLPRNPAK